MRHRKKVKGLGRAKAHREALLANLASSLIRNDYIVTTFAKAKACKSHVDRTISCGITGTLDNRAAVAFPAASSCV